MEVEERPASWPWIAVLIGAPIVVFLTFAVQYGRCADGPSTLTGSCEVGPYVGVLAAFAIAVACGVLVVIAVFRLLVNAGRRRER